MFRGKRFLGRVLGGNRCLGGIVVVYVDFETAVRETVEADDGNGWKLHRKISKKIVKK